MRYMRYMLFGTSLFTNGDIDADVVDTYAYGEDNDDDYVYKPIVNIFALHLVFNLTLYL